MKKLMNNNQSGITMIALIVTIIVLLILAAISIGMATGDNGILKKAGEAKNNAEISEEKEAIGMALVQVERKSTSGNIEIDRLKTEINKQIKKTDEHGAKVSKTFNKIIVVMPSNRKYFIDEQGNIKKAFWDEQKDESGNTIISNDIVKLIIGDYIDYDASSNGEQTYLSSANKTGVSSNQEFSSNYDGGGWRLLGIKNEGDNEYLMIVPANCIKTINNQGYELSGQASILNGLNEMNNICDIYGKGNYALKAEPINLNIINSITGYNPMNTGNGLIYRQGEREEYNCNITVTRTENSRWVFEWENGVESFSQGYSYTYYDEENNIFVNKNATGENAFSIGQNRIIKNTFYSYYPDTLTDSTTGDVKGITTSSREYDVLFKNKSYYIGNKYCSTRYW